MTAFISVWGKHGDHPVHLKIDGRERFPREFSISFDARSGEMRFGGTIGKDRIETLKGVGYRFVSKKSSI